MKTMSVGAADFKARCLDLFDRLSGHELDRVEVTKRGRVVAVITPPTPAPDWIKSLQIEMAGSVDIPEGFDLTAPVLDEAMDAEAGRLHR